MPGPAGKVCCFLTHIANYGTVRNTIAIKILITPPVLDLLKLFFPDDLAPFDRLIGIFKTLGDPGVHAKIKIRKHKNWGLVLFSDVK